jgi:hypothetical protein
MFDTHNWKGIFINYFIQKRLYKSYLELGVSVDADTWKEINCDLKVGVDANKKVSELYEKVINAYTDDFFATNNTFFDVIYIDAKHEKQQVKRDFFNSLKFLNENGVIFFHDINPLNEQMTDFNSSGDVYNFWISLVNNYPDSSFTFVGHEQDTLGIFLNKNKIKIEDFDIGNYNFLYFNKNRKKFIEERKFDFKNDA